jgi:iron complex outermembrane recepter protein
MNRLLPTRRHARFALWLGVACIALLSPARADPDDMSFHITAKPLADALVDFALQAKLSIGYAGVYFGDAVANPVDGQLPAPEALRRLLAGTGFESIAIDTDTVRIRQIASDRCGPPDRPSVEEVVVTTTRRAEIAQSLPYSIAVVSGEDADEAGSRSTSDLTAQVAALASTDLGSGQNKLAIRGLSDGFIAGRSQSLVGLYLDESRLTDDAPDPNLRLVDINRIEVVRGPQGTLYGAGSMGGLVRIITNKPLLDRVEANTTVSAADTEYGTPSSGVDTMLNLPLVHGALGLRAVGYFHRDGGYIDEKRLRIPDANQDDTEGARLSLLLQASDDWTVSAGLTDQLIQAGDSNYYQGGQPFLQRQNYELEPRRDQFLQTNLTVEGTMDWATITNTTAFTKRDIAGQYDASLGWPILTGFPVGPATSDYARQIESITEEARLVTSDEGPFNWTLGGFLSHRDEAFKSLLTGPNAVPAPILARARRRDDYANEAAIFGEGTYKLTDTVSLTAGARVFYASLVAAGRVDQPSLQETASAQGSNHTTGFIPKVVLSYRPSDRLTLYADAAEGFRLGGVNIYSPLGALNVNQGAPLTSAASAFASDRLWTYELGVKTNFLGGRLVTNAAGYFTVWDFIQSDQILRNGSLFTTNAGDTQAPGFEIDLSYLVTRNLRIRVNAFWTDTTTTDSNPILVASQSAGHLPAVPSNNFGASARYGFSLGDGCDGFALVQYSHVGRETLGFDVNNSPKIESYSDIGVRTGVVWDDWQLVLYVKNLLDERSNIFAYGNPFSYGLVSQVTPLRPRTVGIDISWNY